MELGCPYFQYSLQLLHGGVPILIAGGHMRYGAAPLNAITVTIVHALNSLNHCQVIVTSLAASGATKIYKLGGGDGT